MNYKFKAFTIAEVLITLGIIGIVAAITIPTLMTNIQDKELKTAWKKAYAHINNVTSLIVGDDGGTLTNYFTSTSDFMNKYLEKMNHTKTCVSGDASCMYDYTFAKYYDKTTANTCEIGSSCAYTAMLYDGSSMAFRLFRPDCLQHAGQGDFAIQLPIDEYYCGVITVDVNGIKLPNTLGRDIYFMFVEKDRVVLPLIDDCTSSYRGYGCGAKYVYND